MAAAASMSDGDILVQSGNAFLRSVMGEGNWERWQEVRERVGPAGQTLHTFFTWLLDAGEQQLVAAAEQGDTHAMLSLRDGGAGELQSASPGGSSYSSHLSSSYPPPAPPTNPYHVPAQPRSSHRNSFKMRVGGAAVDGTSRVPAAGAPYDRCGVTSEDVKPVLVPEVTLQASYHFAEPITADTAAGGEAFSSDEPCLEFGDDNYSDSAFYCHACQIHVNRVDGAAMHLTKVHSAAAAAGESLLPIYCRYCRNFYATSTDFLQSHHSGCDMRLACPVCGKKFAGKYNLKNHVAKHYERPTAGAGPATTAAAAAGDTSDGNQPGSEHDSMQQNL